MTQAPECERELVVESDYCCRYHCCCRHHFGLRGASLACKYSAPRDQKRREETRHGYDAPHNGNPAQLSHARNRRNGIENTNHEEDQCKRIAAHHPLTVRLDPAGTHAVESGGSCQDPPARLNRGGHHQHRRTQNDCYRNCEGGRNGNADDVEPTDEAVHPQVPLTQTGGELEGRQQ